MSTRWQSKGMLRVKGLIISLQKSRELWYPNSAFYYKFPTF